jgi:hypothetical protein
MFRPGMRPGTLASALVTRAAPQLPPRWFDGGVTPANARRVQSHAESRLVLARWRIRAVRCIADA